MDGHAEAGELAYRNVSTRARPMIAAVALGIARDAIASFTRMVAGSANGRMADQHTIHERIGQAEGLVRAARAYLFACLCNLPDRNDWATEMTESQHADVRLAGAYAARSAAGAVDLVYDAAGARAIYADNRLERCFRDIHVLTQHIGVSSSNFEMVGQHMLGLGVSANAAELG
jgi:alkylation response protein AidB-like acyl-CoA dehydrogenase